MLNSIGFSGQTSFNGAPNAQTGTTYAVLPSDYGRLITFSNASAVTVTLPQQSTNTTFAGFWFDYINLGAGALAFVKEGSETLTGVSTAVQYAGGKFVRNTTTNWHNIGGTNDEVMTVDLPTITALAGAVVAAWRASFAGTVEGIAGTVNAAFTATDIVITGKINNTGITTGVVTIPTAGSAALTTVAVVPTANKAFAIGDIINFAITGGVGAASGVVTFILRRS